MTYLHDYVTARTKIRKYVIPKLIAALMPTMDRLHYEYVFTREGMTVARTVDGKGIVDALIVTLPEGVLPDGYKLRIEFSPVKQAPWVAPDGTPTKGPGF